MIRNYFVVNFSLFAYVLQWKRSKVIAAAWWRLVPSDSETIFLRLHFPGRLRRLHHDTTTGDGGGGRAVRGRRRKPIFVWQ
jgi:hypothetical protein